MRGGKREGAGRKGIGPTKTYRLPIAIEEEVLKILEDYKASLNNKAEETTAFDSVTKSKDSVIPKFPILNKDQIKRLQDWLTIVNPKISPTKARKMTVNSRLCKESFLMYIPLGEESINEKISDLCELYAID